MTEISEARILAAATMCAEMEHQAADLRHSPQIDSSKTVI
jgi:hypothetical protein